MVVEVVKRFHHYSSDLLSELLPLDCVDELGSMGTLAAIVKAIFSTDGGMEVMLDDSALVSVLEWVVAHSCYELVEVVHRLLSKRTLNSGLTLAPACSQSGGSGFVDDVTLVARSLLVSDPSPPNKGVPVPIHAMKSIPFHPDNPLAALLGCLDSTPPYTLTSDHPPLVVKEASIFGMMRLCVKGSTLPCARLLLLLCHVPSSPRAIEELFRTSCLAEVCGRVKAGKGEELQVALCVIGGYLEGLVLAGQKDKGVCVAKDEGRGVVKPEVEMPVVKTLRKQVLEKCVDIALDADSAWPREQQVGVVGGCGYA